MTGFHGIAGPGEVRGRRLEVCGTWFTLTDGSVCVGGGAKRLTDEKFHIRYKKMVT